MKFTTVAAILAFACAAVAAPQGQEGQQGGDGHQSHGPEVAEYCCPIGFNGDGQGYAALNGPVGCAPLKQSCSGDWPVSWACFKDGGHSKRGGNGYSFCYCTSSDNCPDSPTVPGVTDLLDGVTGLVPDV